MKKLPRSFYTREDVVGIARELLGKTLVSEIGGERTAGIITETEAYAGPGDRASHAYGGRRTARNEVMYGRGGTAYIYLCYGIHHLFNVVTHGTGTPHAVLIRAIHPTIGKELMHQRRGGARLTTGGPGTLTQALGIRTTHNGTDLLGDTIYIVDGPAPLPGIIVSGPRIGVDYAGQDALLPYRFHFDPRRIPS